jgi:hypothetical protein
VASRSAPRRRPEVDDTTPRWTPARRRTHCQQIGTLGGQKTVQTYGRTYMATIGRVGFAAYAERHHAGNRAAAIAALKAFTHPDARVRQPRTPEAA